MNYLDYLEPFSTVISAVIAGLFSLIIEVIRSKRGTTEVHDEQPFFYDHNGEVHRVSRISKPKKINAYVIIVFVILGGIFGYIVASNLVDRAGKLPESEVITPTKSMLYTSTPGSTPTLTPSPTQIEYGELITEINFAWRGEGKCNDYDEKRLGYEDKKYYIHPTSSSGYIAICHENDELSPQGALQVLAYPEKNSSYFGYGILFGWKGGGISTTDACIMGIRKSGYDTEAVFADWVDGEYDSSTQTLDQIMLDDQPHILRVVLQPDGLSQGYIDGKFFAEHQFTECSEGPIGMVAWSSSQKIFFDDLKLFEIP
jgi:hypothetical protein